MTDLETLRRHEAALAWLHMTWEHVMPTPGFPSGQADALDWSLARAREAIAKAEAEVARNAAQCPECRGSGSVFSWSSWSDEMQCGKCRGSGKR